MLLCLFVYLCWGVWCDELCNTVRCCEAGYGCAGRRLVCYLVEFVCFGCLVVVWLVVCCFVVCGFDCGCLLYAMSSWCWFVVWVCWWMARWWLALVVLRL